MSIASGRNQRACWKVVGGPARDYDDLEAVGLFGEQNAKPVHASVVALNELVVQDYCRLQILRQREPVQGGQLLTRADRKLPCRPHRSRNHHALRAKLCTQSHAIITSLRQVLKPPGDGWPKR